MMLMNNDIDGIIFVYYVTNSNLGDIIIRHKVTSTDWQKTGKNRVLWKNICKESLGGRFGADSECSEWEYPIFLALYKT